MLIGNLLQVYKVELTNVQEGGWEGNTQPSRELRQPDWVFLL